jgi:predicted TPR repeat methyltransferase
MQSGLRAEAESKCHHILEAFPSSSDAHHLLGVLLGERGETEGASTALERAVKLAPMHAAAWMNLGVIVMKSAPSRAEACFRRVLQLEPQSIPGRGNLATLLHQTGRYSEAVEQLGLILKKTPNDPGALQLLARVEHMRGNFEIETRLIRTLMRLVPNDAALAPNLSRAYFLWYDSVDQEPEKAIRVLEEWLAFEPDAPVARHMHAALTARDAPARATAEYVEQHFDAFAETFDTVLSSLGYRAPEVMRDLLARTIGSARSELDFVDIGCGTGRLGPLVTAWKRNLVGVDLSVKMLDIARKREVYDGLVHADVVAYLESCTATFDVAACLDTLIYFGDISRFLAATRRALRIDGTLLGTVEALEEEHREPYHLHAGGRYAHKKSYVAQALEASGFSLKEVFTDTVRTEHKQPVPGLFFVARRRT